MADLEQPASSPLLQRPLPKPGEVPLPVKVGKHVVKAVGGSVVALPAWLTGLASSPLSEQELWSLTGLPAPSSTPEQAQRSGIAQGIAENKQLRQERAAKEGAFGGVSDVGDFARGFGHLLTTNALSLDSPSTESIGEAIAKRGREAYEIGRGTPGQVAGNVAGIADPSMANSLIQQPLTTWMNVGAPIEGAGGLARAASLEAKAGSTAARVLGRTADVLQSPTKASHGVATMVKRAAGALPETPQLHAAIDALVDSGRLTAQEGVDYKKAMTPWETAAVMHGLEPGYGTAAKAAADVAKGATIGGVLGSDIGLGPEGVVAGSLVGMTPTAMRFVPRGLRAKTKRNLGSDPYTQPTPGETEVMRNVAEPSIRVGKEYEDLAREAGREYGAGNVAFDPNAKMETQPAVTTHVREITPQGELRIKPESLQMREAAEGHVRALEKALEVNRKVMTPDEFAVFQRYANDQLNQIKTNPNWKKSLDIGAGIIKEGQAREVPVVTHNPDIEAVINRMHEQHVASGGEVPRHWFARQMTDVLRTGGQGAHNLLFSERARGLLTEQIVKKSGLQGKAAAKLRTAIGDEIVNRVNRSRLGPEPQSLELHLPNGAVTDLDAELGELVSKSKSLLPDFQREASEKLGRSMGLQAAEHSLRSRIEQDVGRFFPQEMPVKSKKPALPSQALNEQKLLTSPEPERAALSGQPPNMPKLTHEESNFLDAILGQRRGSTPMLGLEEIDHAQSLLDAIESAKTNRISKENSPAVPTAADKLDAKVVESSNKVIESLREKLKQMRAFHSDQRSMVHVPGQQPPVPPSELANIPDVEFEPQASNLATTGGPTGYRVLNDKPVSGLPEFSTYVRNLANALQNGEPSPISLPYDPQELSSALKATNIPAAADFAKRLDSGEYTTTQGKPIGPLLDRAKLAGEFNPKGEGVWLSEGAHDVLNTRAKAIENAQRYESMLDAIQRGHVGSMVNNLLSGYRRGTTILRLPTIARNLVTNDLLASMTNGAAPFQTTKEGLAAAQNMADFYSGKATATPEDANMYRGLSRAGLGGIMTLADDMHAVKSLATAIERNDLSTLSGRAADAITNLGAQVYHQFGDFPVKVGQAVKTYKTIMGELQTLTPGQEYWIDLPHDRSVQITRTADGFEALGKTVNPQQLADLVAHEAVKKASDLFANPNEIGLLWQKMRNSPAAGAVSPFLTWAAHMMDLPGKKGAIGRLLESNNIRRTNNPEIIRSNAKELLKLGAKRALFTGTLQGAADHKNDALRDLMTYAGGSYATNTVTPTGNGNATQQNAQGIDPFNVTGSVINLGRGALAGLVGPGAFETKNMTPDQKRRFDAWSAFERGKLGTSADALKVMGLSGGPMMDIWRDMLQSSPRDAVDYQKAALSLMTSIMGGTPSDMTRVAAEALAEGNPFSHRPRDANGALEDYASWAFRTLTGFGARPIVLTGKKSAVDKYIHDAKSAFHSSVISPIDKQLKELDQAFRTDKSVAPKYRELQNQKRILQNALDRELKARRSSMESAIKAHKEL